jgi:hypothetical protein
MAKKEKVRVRFQKEADCKEGKHIIKVGCRRRGLVERHHQRKRVRSLLPSTPILVPNEKASMPTKGSQCLRGQRLLQGTHLEKRADEMGEYYALAKQQFRFP